MTRIVGLVFPFLVARSSCWITPSVPPVPRTTRVEWASFASLGGPLFVGDSASTSPSPEASG